MSSVLHRQTSWSAAKFLCLAGLGLRQRGQRKFEECLARRVLVLPASEFEHLFEAGRTELAYAGTPLGSLTQHEQGTRCQEWAKKVLQEQNPEAEILDPEPGSKQEHEDGVAVSKSAVGRRVQTCQVSHQGASWTCL